VLLLENLKLVDLTHTLEEGIPSWSGTCGFSVSQKSQAGDLFYLQDYGMEAGIGTHMDAPLHMVSEGQDVASCSLESLLRPLCILDVRLKAHENYKITPQDILGLEALYGKVKKGSVVVGFTGWSQYWSNPKQYRNMDENGEMHFPSFSKEAVELLISRDIAGIGIDTLSPDCNDPEYQVHRLILGQGKYILENLTNLDQVPFLGGYIGVFPIKIKGAGEAPARVVGFSENKSSFLFKLFESYILSYWK
jgi:kynurenine formamidase